MIFLHILHVSPVMLSQYASLTALTLIFNSSATS